MDITVIVIPGPGVRTVTLNDNTTVEQLVTQENLHGRDIIIDGVGVSPANYQTTNITANSEVFATGSVKGNMSNIDLIVIPGPGVRTLDITNGMTVEQLVTQENLHGRDIIIDGVGISPSNYQTTTLNSGSEVFATGSVKGNGNRPANGPSQTGRPSGGGRGNNPPRGK